MTVVEQMEQLALWAARRLVKGSLALEVATTVALECPFCGLYVRRRHTWHPPVAPSVMLSMYKIASSRPS